ncbi:MAG: hypothetical protein OEZ16_11655, partial [Chromatiales bacterium]|nr:hypothetical protein [Chromatiales bacterium]
MDLAKLEFPLRPRGHWEAIDLGFALARRWFRPLLLLWLVTALPVSVMLFLLIGDNLIWLSLAIWWCKPLYEPLMVFWLSRAVFGEQLPVRAVARGWWRINRSALLANITLRRLGPSRSFFMPVALLEGLKGKERSKRIHVLGRNQTAGTWLTIIGVHFEAILQLSLIIGLMILLPDELRWIETNDLFFSPNFVEQLLWLISWMVGMAIIAPFYVAGGFSLYLHRRSELEGWDIEINFRRTVEKLNPQRRQRNLGSVALLLLVIGLISFPPPPVMAGEPGPPQSKALIEQVLAEPRFGLMEQQGYWKYVGEKEEEEEVDPGFLENLVDVLKVFIDIFRGFFQGTASLGEIL